MIDDPIRDAEIHYLHQQKCTDDFDDRYKENLHDFSMFQSFLHDLNSDEPEIKLFFDQLHGDQMDKCYAYDNLIIMYERYVKEVTELLYE